MPSHDAHTVLIGLRCSGKTILGALLAEAHELPFVDLDDRASASMDCATAAEAITRFGLDRFRQAETEALTNVLAEPPSVIALGGGTPTAPGAREILESAQSDGRAVIVYLRASVETLTERMSSTDTSSRPALVGNNPIEEIRTLSTQRDPMYTELARDILEVDGVQVDPLLAALVAMTRPDAQE